MNLLEKRQEAKKKMSEEKNEKIDRGISSLESNIRLGYDSRDGHLLSNTEKIRVKKHFKEQGFHFWESCKGYSSSTWNVKPIAELNILTKIWLRIFG